MKKTENKMVIKRIALNGVMLALIVALQMVNLPNFITGPIVNSILIFIAVYSSLRSAIIICILSPCCGLLTGHVAAPMYPILPFIAAGNVLMVIFFSKFANSSVWKERLLPSLCKASIIAIGGMVVISIFDFNKALTYQLMFFVVALQFFTSIAGIYLGKILIKKFIGPENQ